ncbi:MAG: ribose-phosphate pyrophosphokinae, partial [Labilithrix sp.]|nr:ribose-phosphate pyrophosphokinae [Labilithrix sp.]
IVHKTRLSGHEVEVHDVVGEVAGRSCIIVDDMISTGGTIEAAVAALRARGANAEISVVATHALLVAGAPEALERARIARLVTTDTIASRPGGDRFERIITESVAPLLAAVIRELASGRPLLHGIAAR